MIPDNIDIDDISAQLSADGVAFSSEIDPTLNDALVSELSYGKSQGFGDAGVVIVSETPAHTADLRDIGQAALDATNNVDTVVVRAPGSGAIVSDVHSRAELESAQYDFLRSDDVPTALHQLIDEVDVFSINWPLLFIGVLALAALVAIIAYVQSKHNAVKPLG